MLSKELTDGIVEAENKKKLEDCDDSGPINAVIDHILTAGKLCL